MSEARILATYRLACSGREAVDFARAIAFEQTVEIPEAQVPDDIRERVVGRVEDVVDRSDGSSHAILSYAAWQTAGHVPQLLNLLYGNASMYHGIRLVDLKLPPAALADFPGPRFGIGGVRKLTRAQNRPLLASALKPTGLPVHDLAALAGAFARGGGDLLKDDQNLVSPTLAEFEARAGACADAVRRANDATGGHCQYWPHVAAVHGDLERQLELVRRWGLSGVLMSPVVHGLEQTRGLVADYGLACMAHPSLTGAFTAPPDHGIAHGVLLGTLFRLAGADVSVFPNHGGRFAYEREDCLQIRDRLREPLGDLKPAFPCPAGGMQFASLGEMVADYGDDAVFLVGGALLGHDRDLEHGTRAFRDEILRHAEG